MPKSIRDALDFLDTHPDTISDAFAPDKSAEDKLVAIYLRVSPEARRNLKRLAIDRDSNCQKLMEEALDDLFIKYRGKPR